MRCVHNKYSKIEKLFLDIITERDQRPRIFLVLSRRGQEEAKKKKTEYIENRIASLIQILFIHFENYNGLNSDIFIGTEIRTTSTPINVHLDENKLSD